jgi:hypothetical protein
MALLPVEKFCVIGVCCCNGTSPSPFESSSSTRSIQDFLSASILKILCDVLRTVMPVLGGQFNAIAGFRIKVEERMHK